MRHQWSDFVDHQSKLKLLSPKYKYIYPCKYANPLPWQVPAFNQWSTTEEILRFTWYNHVKSLHIIESELQKRVYTMCTI